MRHFPFRILVLCVLLPPLVYTFAINFLERSIQASYEHELAATYIGDTRDLFAGSIRLKDAINDNVNAFLNRRHSLRWGLRVNITVKSKDGTYLYPIGYTETKSRLASEEESLAVARTNFGLLTDGLMLSVEVKIEHNTLISNSILFICVSVALLVLFVFYRRGLRMNRHDELAEQEILHNLANRHRESMESLKVLEKQRISLEETIHRAKLELENERRKSSATEEELVDELVALEGKINENQTVFNQQLKEIDSLKEEIRQFAKEQERQDRQLRKGSDAARKRFNALYKKLIIHDHAVEGYADLTEEMKIKAEEVIHQLNDDPKMIQIKRKVFGKKNRETVFEVIFSYKGRLYFRMISGNRIEVLTIGTKLSQNKDLAFLDNL